MILWVFVTEVNRNLTSQIEASRTNCLRTSPFFILGLPLTSQISAPALDSCLVSPDYARNPLTAKLD